MSWLRNIASGLRSLFRKDQVDRELTSLVHGGKKSGSTFAWVACPNRARRQELQSLPARFNHEDSGLRPTCLSILH